MISGLISSHCSAPLWPALMFDISVSTDIPIPASIVYNVISKYDLACNGYELVSGAIRNHRPEIMFKAFEIAGYDENEVKNSF